MKKSKIVAIGIGLWLAVCPLVCSATQVEEVPGALEQACIQVLPTGDTGIVIRLFLRDADALLDQTTEYYAKWAQEGTDWQSLQIGRRTSGGEVGLFVVRVSPQTGEVRLPDEGTLAMLADREYVEALVACTEWGIPVRAEWYDQPASYNSLLQVLTLSYEALSGTEIQTVGLEESGIADLTLQKAELIGLVYDKKQASQGEAPDSMAQSRLLLSFVQAATDGIAHRAAAPVGGEEAAQALSLILQMLDQRQEAPLLDVQVLTREDYAKLVVPVFLAHFSSQEDLEQIWMPEFDDTEETAARWACGLSLMEPVYPPGTDLCLFEGERVMTRWALQEALQRFAEVALSTQGEGFQDQDWGAVLPRITALLETLQPLCAQPAAQVVVNNDRPYDWYLRQEGTGPYSTNNCMPAATAMVLRWAEAGSRVTVQQMRNLHPLSGTGWYPQQVQEVLDSYHVDYTTPPISLSSMLTALDRGHILLALVHEGAYGHCVIVKGYIREEEGLWFLCYDPASPQRDVYGAWVGKNRRIEAGEMLRAMENHWWLYFDIVGVAVD